ADRLSDHRGYVVYLREIVCDRDGLDAATGKVLLRLPELFCLARRDHDLATHVAQPFGDLQPQAARPTGHERHLALEVEKLASVHLRHLEESGGAPGAAD